MEEMKWKMMEQAEEELQRLETLRPDGFHVLKMELKSLISLLQDSISLSHPLHHHHFLIHHDHCGIPSPSASTASTQASTCRKRKKVVLKNPSAMEVDQKHSKTHKEEEEEGHSKNRDDRVEAVLQRAQLCLQKLQAFKNSFF